MRIKLSIFILGMLLFSFASAVTIENQTVIHENTNNGAEIQLEQDTIADLWSSNEDLSGIEITNLQTFNSTFTNLNTTNTAKIIFYDLDNVTIHYSNGTNSFHSGVDFDLNVTVPTNGYVVLATGVLAPDPSDTIIIKPDFVDTVPHIILGRRLIFSWVINLLF